MEVLIHPQSSKPSPLMFGNVWCHFTLYNACHCLCTMELKLIQWYERGAENLQQYHGSLARYVKLWIAHAPRMPGTFSQPPQVSDLDMHHGTCVTCVSWCMLGSLPSGIIWSRCGENGPGIPGACGTRNFTYLVRGPCGKIIDLTTSCKFVGSLYNFMKVHSEPGSKPQGQLAWQVERPLVSLWGTPSTFMGPTRRSLGTIWTYLWKFYLVHRYNGYEIAGRSCIHTVNKQTQ